MDDRDSDADGTQNECSAFIPLMHAVAMDAMLAGLNFDPDAFPNEDGEFIPAAREGILGAILRGGGDASPSGALKSCFGCVD